MYEYACLHTGKKKFLALYRINMYFLSLILFKPKSHYKVLKVVCVHINVFPENTLYTLCFRA